MENIILHLTCCISKMKRKKEKYQNSKEKKIFLGDVCQTAEIFKEFQWPQT